MVIPFDSIGFIEISYPDGYDGEMFIEDRLSSEVVHEYSMPSCVTTIKEGSYLYETCKPTTWPYLDPNLLPNGTIVGRKLLILR